MAIAAEGWSEVHYNIVYDCMDGWHLLDGKKKNMIYSRLTECPFCNKTLGRVNEVVIEDCYFAEVGPCDG
jgi:hypothetical protein